MAKTATDFFFENMGKYPLLPDHEILELAKHVQRWKLDPAGPENCPPAIRHRGQWAADKIIRHNLRLIVHIWRQTYSARIPATSNDFVDALQTCALDLVAAAAKYKPETGNKFSTYAALWIHKGFKGFLAARRLVRIPINSYHLIASAQRIIAKAKAEERRVPSIQEVRDELAKTRKHVPTAKNLAEWLHASYITDAISYDAPASKSDGTNSMGDHLLIEPEGADSEDDVSSIYEAMQHLSEEEQKVVKRRFLQGKPVHLVEIGKELGMSKSKVSLVEKQAVRSLKNLCRVD